MDNRVIASLVVAALIIGLAFGTVFFPRTLTHTVTSSVFLGTFTTSVYPESTTATNSVSITTVNSEIYVTLYPPRLGCTACNTTIGGTLVYSLSVYYGGGPWILHYWVQNYTGTQNSISGSLLGSGNSDIWIEFYVKGAVQYTLCASATKVSNDYLPLTLSLSDQNQTTTGSNDMVEHCGTMGV